METVLTSRQVLLLLEAVELRQGEEYKRFIKNVAVRQELQIRKEALEQALEVIIRPR